MWDSQDWREVVFVSDAPGAALRRRERCLRLAGIAACVLTERRPSGTYYKLCVREQDVLNAHCTLQLGGFCRAAYLRRRPAGIRSALTSLAYSVWDEVTLLLTRLVDTVTIAPRLLVDGVSRAAGEASRQLSRPRRHAAARA